MPLPLERLAGQVMALLGLPATDVWAMTPREIAAVFDALTPEKARPMTRKGLRELMSLFPDAQGKHNAHG